MKGIVNTIETGVGTVILLVIVVIGFGSQLSPQDNPSSYNSVQAQLDRLDDTGKLEEYVKEKNNSALKSEINSLPLRMNVTISHTNIKKSSNSSDSFEFDFEYKPMQDSPFLFLWSGGNHLTAQVNGNEVYDGRKHFTLIDIRSETSRGTNSIQIDNPSERRVGYLLTTREGHETPSINDSEVRIIRRMVITEEGDNIGEVTLYLW